MYQRPAPSHLLAISAATLSLLFSFNAEALVDYTESAAPEISVPKAAAAPKSSAPAVSSSANVKQNSAPSSGMFEIALSYEAVNVKEGERHGDAALARVDTHFQTPFSLFVDLSFWRLNTVSEGVDFQERADNGNPVFKLGFNWLQFGKGHDAATVDLYGAYSFKGSNGVAASRDDKMVGVETAKRFYDFALALGFEYQLTGSPSDQGELEIGNVQRILASVGWMVSHDIQFIVEGGNVKVKESSEVGPNKLAESFSYSYVSPAARLGISPLVNLELGAVFRTQKPEVSQDLVSARMWGYKGIYGNSLYAALRVDI